MSNETMDDLVLGGDAIAAKVFGNRLSVRQVYRLADDAEPWPLFRLRGQIACRLGAMLAEAKRRERRATEPAAHSGQDTLRCYGCGTPGRLSKRSGNATLPNLRSVLAAGRKAVLLCAACARPHS